MDDTQEAIVLLQSAKSIRGILGILLPLKEPSPEIIVYCQRFLPGQIPAFKWEECPEEEIEAEVVALCELHERFGDLIVEEHLVCEVLKAEGFRASVGANTLLLLSKLLRNKFMFDFGKFKQIQERRELSRACSVWISRLIPALRKKKLRKGKRKPLKGDNNNNKKDDKKEEARESMLDDEIVQPSTPITKVMYGVLDWWSETINRLLAEKTFSKKEVEFLINAHLAHVLSSYPAKELLGTVNQVAEMYKVLHPYVLNCYPHIIREKIIHSSIPDIFPILFPNRKSIDRKQQKKLIRWHLRMLRAFILTYMQVLDSQTVTGVGENERFSYLQLYKESAGTVSFSMLLDQANEAWCNYIYWYTEQLPVYVNDTDLPVKDLDQWETLTVFFNMGKTAFLSGYETIQDGSASIRLIADCLKVPEDVFHSCWNSLGVNNINSEMENLSKEIQFGLELLGKYKLITSNFMKQSKSYSEIVEVEKKWSGLALAQMRYFLRLDGGSVNGEGMDHKPLEENLVKSLDWMFALVKSQLFNLIWSEQKVKNIERQEDVLIPASRDWKSLYNDVDQGKITFHRLRTIAPILSELEERNLFSMTAPNFSEEKGLQWKFQPKPTKKWVEKTATEISDWRHLFAVYENLPSIRRVLDCLHVFLKPSAINQLEKSKKSAETLQTIFKNENFDEKILKDFSRFSKDSKNLAPCLTWLNAELFEQITESLELLDWLRESPDDSNFTSSLEEAMGRSEMECPVELWEEQEGKPGRVDEQKLSMLNTVRGYLHDLIFRPDDKLDNLSTLIGILTELRPTDDNVISSLKIANEFRLPLMELLDNNSDNGAPDRLMQLLLPERRAEWVCTSTKHGRGTTDITTIGQVWLKWYVPRRGQDLEKRQNLNELMDFQSTVVLARTDQRSKEIQETIEKFILQFGWIKQLNENLCALNLAGHFDFQQFNYQFPMAIDPAEIRAEAVRTQSLLHAWVEGVQAERLKNYFLNYYSMKHIWRLITAVSTKSDAAEFNSTMADLLRLVNPDSAADKSQVDAFVTKFTEVWEKGSTKNASAMERLKLCGAALGEGLKKITCRFRPVTTASVANYPAGADILVPGVHVICADSSRHVYDHILSLYARAGYVPERELICVCRPGTHWDDINTLLLRWARANEFGRGNKVYTLAGIESLSFELQRKAALAIKENLSKLKNTLVIISGNADNQHLVAQFAHCRAPVIALPEEVLQEFSSEFFNSGKSYSQGISVVTSKHAGAGKSFHIRTQAYKSNADALRIPVFHSKNILSRLTSIYDKHSYDVDYILLHLDIYDTVGEDLNAIIFELVFLGGIEDSTMGRQFFWNPETVSIAIEVAYGDVIKNLRICSLLPQVEVVVNGDTFCVDRDNLEIGMGPEFETARNDGTALRSTSENELANAYLRLQYICFGLDMMDKNQGRFPYVFETPKQSILDTLRISQTQDSITNKTEALTSKRSFDLLMAAAKLDERKPSLWCLWNFINVFYWQLRDMHYPDSPINCACMPDKSSNRANDATSKAKLKGEVVQFLIRTAREFATRQVKKDNSNAVTALHVSGITKVDYNGLWERMEFDHDGRPAFKREGKYSKVFMYYRVADNAWVIDDIIEPTGAVFSRCQGTDINGDWFTSPDWGRNPDIRVTLIKNSKGHNSEAVKVEGCKDDGGSVSAKENGIYLRQPPYDDISDKPHYIMHKKEGDRRHLFFQKEGAGNWQISPVCNNEQGAYCMSALTKIDGPWKSIPKDKLEDRAIFTFVRERDRDQYVKMPLVTYQTAKDRDRKANQSLLQSLGVDNDGEFADVGDDMEALWDNTLKWNDGNHECLLFSNETHVVSFLSLDPQRLRSRMHPGLLAHLERNQINVGEDLDKLSTRFHEVLSALTEVKKTEAQAKQILDGKYCLTGDNLLKMLAIFARLRCGVPVVLMGECGCGKTMLITYLCAWMDVKLLVLDVHGGTSENDILNIFHRAEIAAGDGKRQVFVFLDEINTCGHMGLFSEVICNRSLYGKRLSDSINVLAALNPYRLRKDRGNTPGLVFQLHGAGVTPDAMSKLVYRVHPIPHTLRDFIFDFGALQADKEKLYIQSMIQGKIQAAPVVCNFISDLINVSQIYTRKVEGDPSSASLRDVRRCMNLISWFQSEMAGQLDKQSESTPLATFTVLALAFVYYYRLSSAKDREQYWITLETDKGVDWGKIGILEGFGKLKAHGSFARVLLDFQQNFCSHIDVEQGIAMNQALMENLFVVIICILNRIPVFVVGKPGSSKTLTMQVIASNLQGKQSSNPFWRKYPAIYTFPYQCSPMSDSHSIQHQFDMAVRYQEHAENTITVLLLDEVGLAEHSPDMPLKVLHGMLVDPPIAVVGLSNWVLDPAKMNRAICLQRTEPSENDIKLTGQRIMTSGSKSGQSVEQTLSQWLAPLAAAYHEIYTNQKGRDFVGMRDYYNLVKLLRYKLGQGKNVEFNESLLTFSLCRNFGGKKELLQQVLDTFVKCCFNKATKVIAPAVTQLIRANLEDLNARHLMLLTKNSIALSLAFGSGLLNELTTKVLIGSEFAEDKTELHLVTQINEIKLAMASGSTVVLLNHDNIYEALYDVLNQRYLLKRDQNNKEKKMLRLAIGSRSQLCQVAPGFKIVVIVEQNHAYNNLDLPLLNRFEKQVLCSEDVIGNNQTKVVKQITSWVDKVVEETGMNSVQDIFCGFHPGTVPTAVLTASEFTDANIDESKIPQLKLWLLKVARPIAVMHSKELAAINTFDYFKHHASLPAVLEYYIYKNQSFGAACCILTHSPVYHLDMVLDANKIKGKTTVLQLAELTSERQLESHLTNFFYDQTAADSILVVQCDPIACKQSLINHARYICVKSRVTYQASLSRKPNRYKRHMLFVVHLPPGIKQRDRQFTLDFIAPWEFIFIDDLRPDDDQVFNTVTMLNRSAYELAVDNLLSLDSMILSKYQHALSSCTVAAIDHPVAFFGNRINTLRKLLFEVPEFLEMVKRCLFKVLESHKEKVVLTDNEESSRVHVHVKMVCGDLVGGSLRQSLQLALQIIVVQALAHIIRRLDCNYNLSRTWESDASFKLWFALARCPPIFDPPLIATNSKIGGKDALVHSEVVQNTGQFGPLVAQFPFSYKIIPILNDPATRERVEELKGNTQETLANLCGTIFSEEVVAAWDVFASKNHVQYLNDFVAIAAVALPGLSFEHTLTVYSKIIRITRFDSLVSPAGIHTAVWNSDTRLFRCCSLLSNIAIPEIERAKLLSVIEQYPVAEVGSDCSRQGCLDRLAKFDFCILSNILASLIARASTDSLENNLVKVTHWINEFSAIRSDVEQYLQYLLPYDGPELAKLRAQYLGLKTLNVFFQEVLKEFLLFNVPLGKPYVAGVYSMLTNQANPIQPQSSEYFTQLADCVCGGIGSKVFHMIISFIRRYLQEIVFGEQEEFYNIGSNHVVEPQFIKILNSIINKEFAKWKQLCEDLPLCRVIVHCLLRMEKVSEEKGIENKGDLLDLVTVHSRVLYLQHQEDLLTSIQSWEGILSKEDIETTGIYDKQTPVNNTQWRKYLEALSKVKVFIRLYILKIVENGMAVNQAPVSSFYIPICKKLMEDPVIGTKAKVLALKTIRNFGGVDYIGELISLPQKDLPWLPVQREMMTNASLSLPDPFSWISNKEDYEAVCGAVRSCATQSNNNTTQLDKIGKKSIHLELLGAAIFSQTVLERRSLFEAGLKSLTDWSVSAAETRYHEETLLYRWLCRGCPYFETFLKTDTVRGACQLQVAVHLALLFSKDKSTFFYSMLFDPEEQKSSYLISVPDDPFMEIVQASGRVGWYVCPNGHRYSVGQCTMPMQASKCTACGASIGGANHVSVKGVRRLNDNELGCDPKLGYDIDNNESDAVRLATLNGRIMRFVLHTFMLVSASLSADNEKAISQIMFRYTAEKKNHTVGAELAARLEFDWKTIRNMTNLDDGSLAIALHLIIRNFRNEVSHSNVKHNRILSTTVLRNYLETKLSELIDKVMTNRQLRERIEEVRTDLAGAGKTSAIRLATGEKLWFEIHEQQLAKNEKPTEDLLLWRFREPVSYGTFQKKCEVNQVLLKTQHKLLSTFMKEEKRLHSLRGVADILSWHKILFEIVPHMTISRIDALEITNIDIINKLPAYRQEKAKETLRKFCEVFNEVLPTIDPLYECEKNPFITSHNGEVDFGEGKKMDFNTPIAFSLPSMVTGSDKGDFINGVCTIKILELLVDSQNEVIQAIKKVEEEKKDSEAAAATLNSNKAPGGRKAPAARKGAQFKSPVPIAAPVVQRPQVNIPAVNYLTPAEVLRGQLIFYDREEHLLPLLRIFANQSLGYGEGASLDFDFKQIEDAIANGLLASKLLINLCIRHYQYKGDVKRMGHLEGLSAKIQQDTLSPSLREQILSEIDTQERLMRLMQQLEVCIGFIVSVGSDSVHNLSGNTPLSTYVVNTLHTPQNEWDEISTAGIKQQISLKHLQALYLCLEERVFGNPMDDVLACYRENLTESEEVALKTCAPKLVLGDLLAIFHRFLLDQLTNNSIPPGANLKEYLEYASAHKSSACYLEDEDWWVDNFPDNLTCSVAKTAYDLLNECQN